MPQYTLASIDARVLDRLDNNTGLYPTAQRYAEINDSLKVVNLFAPFAMDTLTVAGGTVAGQQFYAVPPTMIFPLRVYFNNRQLEKLSLRAISMRYRTWVTDRSNTGMPVQEWIPAGLSFFGIHPVDSTSGGVLLVNGVVEPALLVAPGDFVTVQDQYIDVIEKLTAHVLQVKESAAIFTQSSMLYQSFIHDMKEMTSFQDIKMPRYFVKLSPPEEGGPPATGAQ